MHNIIVHNPNLTPVSNLMRAAINRFLIETRRDKSAATLKAYTVQMRIFSRWVESFAMTSDTRSDLKAFQSWLKQQYTSPASINLALSVVRSFYRSLHERGIIPEDPTVVLKNVPDSDEVKKSAITKKQFYDILRYLDSSRSHTADRNRVLFVLMSMNGLRISEAANACVEDIQHHNGRRVLYLKRKGYESKVNYVVLQEKTYQMLMDFIGDKAEGPIFVSAKTGNAMTGGDLSRVVKTIFRQCGIDEKNITSHSLRHFFAVTAIEAGAEITALMKAMNHKSMSTTQRYLVSYDRANNAAEDLIDLDF